MSDLGLGKVIENRDYKVESRGYETSCWTWLHATNSDGYGFIRVGEDKITAHRYIYCVFNNISLPDKNIHADHLCRNRNCINPAHVRLTSLRQNVLSGNGITAQNKRLTECRTCGGELKTRKRSFRTSDSRYCPKCQYEKQKAKSLKVGI